MHYTNDKGDAAKVIDYDPSIDTVAAVINDKVIVKDWDEFIEEFKSMGFER